MRQINENNAFSNELEIKKYRDRTIIGAAVALVGWLLWMMNVMYFHNFSFWIFLFALCPFLIGAAVGNYNYGKYKMLSSGNNGEKRTLNVLTDLSDDYLVLHNVEIYKGDKKTELDMLVVSPFGLQIIEVKNHNGNIEGYKEDAAWTQYKVGRGGTPYTSSMKNPLKQLGFQKHLLSEILKDHGLKIWIDGYVYMPTATNVNVDSDNVVTDGYELIEKIENKNAVQISEENIQKIINILTQTKYKKYQAGMEGK